MPHGPPPGPFGEGFASNATQILSGSGLAIERAPVEPEVRAVATVDPGDRPTVATILSAGRPQDGPPIEIGKCQLGKW
jgi:hypothetical protein